MNFIRSTRFLGLILLLLLGVVFLYMFDLVRGDGNGVVAGIRLEPMLAALAGVLSGLTLAGAFLWKNKLLQNTVLLLVVMGLTIGFLEWITGKYTAFQASQAPRIEGPTHSMKMDSVLGYKPEANASLTAKRTKNDSVIYDVAFQTDAHSLRVTPLSAAAAPTQYAQFYGCSMTFGEGVQSNQTLPYFAAAANPAYRPYNFAFSGYGPHQMLARLESGQVPGMVSEKNGFGVYVYIPDHVNRVINSYTNYGYNHGEVPRYELENGKLVRKGTFAQTARLRNLIFGWMQKSNILKAFNIGYPFKLAESDYELTAEVVAQSGRLYQKQFGNDRFYAVIYPTYTDQSKFVEQLKKRGVKVLDYSKLFDSTSPVYGIPDDGHPTPKGHATLAEQLMKDVAAPQTVK